MLALCGFRMLKRHFFLTPSLKLIFETYPAPLALHQLVVVSPGGEAVIRLAGYDLDGDGLVATITSLPGSGTLHQASRYLNVLSTLEHVPGVGVGKWVRNLFQFVGLSRADAVTQSFFHQSRSTPNAPGAPYALCSTRDGHLASGANLRKSPIGT